MKQRFSAGEQYPELLISNYDTGERRKMQMQISLVDIFDWEDREQEEPE